MTSLRLEDQQNDELEGSWQSASGISDYPMPSTPPTPQKLEPMTPFEDPRYRPDEEDPYDYHCGFGNHHASEAIKGALPRNGTNMPQKHPMGLFPEHLNGTSFISSRENVSNV